MNRRTPRRKTSLARRSAGCADSSKNFVRPSATWWRATDRVCWRVAVGCAVSASPAAARPAWSRAAAFSTGVNKPRGRPDDERRRSATTVAVMIRTHSTTRYADMELMREYKSDRRRPEARRAC
ncbi:MAG: hypothetical protein AUG09_07255 [Acidobacteria bacterium 13_1_20CM_2_68_7]|nr:MAG: hypothetical protein AUG09_07255 [Acidobacteria bacterium 13_1_20CM_2_68_7]